MNWNHNLMIPHTLCKNSMGLRPFNHTRIDEGNCLFIDSAHE